MGKKKRVANEPQKPPSAYALFFKETQAPIKIQNPTATFGEVSKIVGSLWNSLDDESKNQYKKKQELAKKEYLQAFNKYKASLAVADSGAAATAQDISDDSHIEEQGEDSEGTAATGSNSFTALSSAAASTGTMKQMNPNGIQDSVPAAIQGAANAMLKTGIPANVQNSETITNGEPIVNGIAEVASNGDHPSEDKEVGPMVPPVVPKCIRAGCNNPGVHNPEWEDEYCSTDCVVSHCRDVFNNWVAGNNRPETAF